MKENNKSKTVKLGGKKDESKKKNRYHAWGANVKYI